VVQYIRHDSNLICVHLVVTGYGLDDRGDAVRVPVGPRTFTHPYRPSSLLFNGYGGLCPGLEADHLPQASFEVKKT
jgi:hypothetical protein